MLPKAAAIMDYPQPFPAWMPSVPSRWCGFFPASQPGPGCGAFSVAKGASQLGQEAGGAALTPCSCGRAFPGCFLPGAGVRRRTGNSGCTIIAEPIVWGKGRIRACSHPPVSRCAERMWWGSRGCWRSTKLRAGFVQSSRLAQIPAFLPKPAPLVFHGKPRG